MDVYVFRNWSYTLHVNLPLILVSRLFFSLVCCYLFDVYLHWFSIIFKFLSIREIFGAKYYLTYLYTTLINSPISSRPTHPTNRWVIGHVT